MTEKDVINERLEAYYGTEIDGRARYRVEWTTFMTEMRKGEFNEFYGSIYLRTTIGTQLVLKYPYDQDRWVIEKLFYVPNKEIVSEKPGSYEPLLILKDKNGQYLPLNWKVVQKVVDHIEGPKVMLTDKDWKSEEDEERKREIAYFEDELADRGRSSLFASENSAFVSATKRFQ